MSIATIITRGFGTFGSIAEVVTKGFISGAPAATKVAEVRLGDLAGVDRANLTNILWAWYDLPPEDAAPVISGTDTSNALGELTLVLTGTTLDASQTGYLVLTHVANGWQSIHAVEVTLQ